MGGWETVRHGGKKSGLESGLQDGGKWKDLWMEPKTPASGLDVNKKSGEKSRESSRSLV